MSDGLTIPAMRLSRSNGALPPLDTHAVSLPRGSVLAVTGPSGSGKSLWLKSLFGWAAPEQKALLSPKDGAFLMTQDPSRGLTPGYGIRNHFRDVLGKDTARAETVLEALGLNPAQVWERKPDALSGGQKQRLMLAMVLVSGPRVLVCDEPAASLDPENEARLWELVLRPQFRPETLIFVTHRLGLIEAHADRVLLLDQGRIRFDGTKEAFFDEPEDPLQAQLVQLHRRTEARESLATANDGPPLLEARNLALSYSGTPTFSRANLGTPTFSNDPQLGTPTFSNDPQLGNDPPLGTPTFSDGHLGTPIFSGISLTIRRGGWLWLSGPSGSGKTSLARLIAGLAPFGQGELMLDGEPLELDGRQRTVARQRAVQYVFQHGGRALNPAVKVGRQLRRLWGEDRQGMTQTLAALGLADLELERTPLFFSQGELQRLNLTATLSVRPQLIICDEILEPLDLALTHLVLDFLADRCRRTGLAVIMISHDPALPETRGGEHLRLG